MIKQPAVPCRATNRIIAATFFLKHLLEELFLPLSFFLFLLIVSEVAGLVPAMITLQTVGNSLKLRAQRRRFLYKRGLVHQVGKCRSVAGPTAAGLRP